MLATECSVNNNFNEINNFCPNSSVNSDNGTQLNENENKTENENEKEITEPLDEKRQIRAVQEYLYRLYEVRDWLINCIGEESMPKVTELENDLRNGILLARIANYCAPELISLDKIFDLNKKKYTEDGVSYRHIDNIVAFRKAALSVCLPDVIVPETVDVYEGRNARTIFCLYALAIRLFRLRKAPPIRNQTGIVQFTEKEFETIKNRFMELNQNLNFANFSFGNLNKVLSNNNAKPCLTNATDKNVFFNTFKEAIIAGDLTTIIELLNSFGDLCVVSSLAEKYLLAFQAQQLEDLNMENIRRIANEVNVNDCFQRLKNYLLSGNTDLNDLSLILIELSVNQVMEISMVLYWRVLKQIFEQNSESFDTKVVHNCVELCNACTQLKIASIENDVNEVYEVLCNPLLQLSDILNYELKTQYVEEVCHAFNVGDIYIPEIRDIITKVNEEAVSPKFLTKQLYDSWKMGNKADFLKLARKLSDELFELTKILPAETLINCILKIDDNELNITNLNNCFTKIKQDYLAGKKLAEWVFSLNKAIAQRKKDQVLILLTTKNDEQIDSKKLPPQDINIFANWYMTALSKAQVNKIKDGPCLDKQLSCICESIENLGNIFVLEKNCQLVCTFENLNQELDEWALTSCEIMVILKQTKQAIIDYYAKSEGDVQKVQSKVRDFLRRQKNKKREKASKVIQKAFRLHSARKFETELKDGKCPSLNCVRNFVKMLENTAFDYDEELKIEHIRGKINQLISQNKNLKTNVDSLDKQIGLLVRNLISAQEASAHKDRIVHENHKSAETLTIEAKKSELEKLKVSLSIFFFYLQTEPIYLTNLIEDSCFEPGRLSNPLEFFHNILLPTFNNLDSSKRDKTLAISLFTKILKLYIDRLHKIEEFMDGNNVPCSASFTLLFGAFFRHISNNSILKQLESDLIQFLEEAKFVEFNLIPCDIYKKLFNNTIDSVDLAIADCEVLKALETSKSFTLKWIKYFAEKFLTVQLPDSVTYFLRICAIECSSKFTENLSADVLNRVLSLFLFQTCFNFLTMLRLESGSVGNEEVEIGGVKILTQQQEYLKTIANVLKIAFSGHEFGSDVFYLQSMNIDLKNVSGIFTDFVNKIQNCTSKDQTDSNLTAYSIYDSSNLYTLKLTPKQIQTIVHLVDKNSDKVISDSSNMSHLFESLHECWKKFNDDNNVIILSLRPMSIENENVGQYSSNELFIQTKKNVISLLLLNCKGSNIEELVKINENEDTQLQTLKSGVRKNLTELESNNSVFALHHYQELVNEIAKDIQYKALQRDQRIAELRLLEAKVENLNLEKIALDSQLKKYKTCLESCIENMTSRRPTILFGKEGGKQEKELKRRTAEEHNFVLKISGDKLLRKNLLADCDFQSTNSTTTKSFLKINLEISRLVDTRWTFIVLLRQSKSQTQSTKIDIQDMIQAENEERLSMQLFPKIYINPTNFRQYLTKKFFNRK